MHIVIHSSIADNGNWVGKNVKGQTPYHQAVLLWYYTRAIDTCGSGWAEVDLREVSKLVGRTEGTIHRWRKWGLKLGIFRAIAKVAPHRYKVFYTSLVKVCANNGITSIGACGRVGLEALVNLKFHVTELEALKLQKQSFHQEKHKRNADQNKYVPTAADLLSSDLGSGAIAGRSDRFIYLKRSAFAHGGNQRSVAHRIGRHVSTVQRRLANNYREQHSLPPVKKAQLLTAPRYLPPVRGVSRLVPNQLLLVGPHKQFFTINPNVYDIEREIYHAKNRQRELNKVLNRDTEDDWKFNSSYQELMKAWKQSVNPQTINSPYTQTFVEKIAPGPSFPEISISLSYKLEEFNL